MTGRIYIENDIIQFTSFLGAIEFKKYDFYWDCECCCKKTKIDSWDINNFHKIIKCPRCGELLSFKNTLIEIKLKEVK